MAEKVPQGKAQPLLQQRTSKLRPTLAALWLLVTAFMWIRSQHLVVLGDDDGKSPSWSWEDVKPSRTLQWNNCYDASLECARLDVPMDWKDPSDNERVTLGVVKLAAKSKKNSLPPVFINPGGLGGLGVYLVQKAGAELQTIVGDNQDIISWDPRGVGVSTPRMECWGTAQKRELWNMQDAGVIDERTGLLYDTYSRGLAYAGACEAALNNTNILKHISTAYHARDMLEILDGTGFPKLRYWGLSYGTALGGAFAGLFPDRVERLVSDGNVDYNEWFGQGLRNYLTDTDTIFDAFDSACHKAGKDKCAFWAPSANAVQERRASLLASLKKWPVLIPASSRDNGPEMPERVTYSKVQRLTQALVYAPARSFGTLALVYAALEAGNGLPYHDVQRAVRDKTGGRKSELLCSLTGTPTTIPQETAAEPDAFSAIMCSDSRALGSLDEFEEYARVLQASSRWMGATHADFGAACVGRTIKPKWRFTMDDIKADTDYPILYIGNMADNVTPLGSAYNNSAHFPSSAVLVQKSYGHCSLAAPSTCTARYIRAYFQDGTLPTSGTECEQDYELFDMLAPGDVQVLGQRDELSRAVYELARKVEVVMHYAP
ncbi:Carboxylesterase A [Tolypocladium ophioglossoides CBS 100239]|uniref:Carboxylesterase A n=1 Tax=Tolypocladium ophioglossoides (strain CBS 100239) TaxID=1163406 RepID=A0A0L0NN83_TOLOC|nr:Carboxylesterase A [Tolypocladium ophioglossoides CBS 100239]